MVERCPGLQLSCDADDAKRRSIGTAELISEGIAVSIRCSDSRADIGMRCRVLRYGSRRAGAIGEHRRIVRRSVV